MGGIFGGGGSAPAAPTPPAPPPAPSPAPTIDAARDARNKLDNNLARKGRAAAILTGDQGDLSSPNVGTKQLLGS
jgi:hypothetical protein